MHELQIFLIFSSNWRNGRNIGYYYLIYIHSRSKNVFIYNFSFSFPIRKRLYSLMRRKEKGKSFELSFIHENVWGRWKINAEQALSLVYTFEPWTKVNQAHKHTRLNSIYCTNTLKKYLRRHSIQMDSPQAMYGGTHHNTVYYVSFINQ